MGAVNCCIDATAVDELAYSACDSTTASQVILAPKRIVQQIALGDGVSTTSTGVKRCDAPLEERLEAPVAYEPAAGPMTERHSESAVTQRERVLRQRKIRITRRTQSLPSAASEPTLYLRDYLCPCDPCPHSLCADRLLDAFYGDRPLDASTQTRHLVHRVLRGCATFDERNVLDQDLVHRAYQLVEALEGDEDHVFRAIVAPAKPVSCPTPRYLPHPDANVESVAMRRSSAVTA